MVLGFGLGGEILGNVSATLQYTVFRVSELLANDKITSCTLVTEMDTGFVVGFAVMLLLAWVFRYGEELQKRDDETL